MKKPEPITHEGLPLFNMELDETAEAGMDFIALVKSPATKQPFFAFNEDEKKKELKDNSFKFGVSNEEKQLITGVVMLADTPIYRQMDEDEFYVTFTPDIIEKMAFKYMKNQFTKNVNIEHDENKQVGGVYLVESYLFDETRGVKIPEYLGEITNGSWIATFKIDNKEVWQKIKNNDFSGFSLEGNFGLSLSFNDNKEIIEKNSLLLKLSNDNLTTNQKYNLILNAVKGA